MAVTAFADAHIHEAVDKKPPKITRAKIRKKIFLD